MNGIIKINFNQLLFRLLCIYAFLIPFEKAFEILLDIDTVLKPYRIIALFILIIFSIKSLYKWNRNKEIKRDVFLYSIFIYGLLITALKMITVPFSTSLFYNDALQLGLYLTIFFIIRHTELDMKKLITISKFLATGVIINGIYIFYNFFILRYFRRETGFMDNPNYMALSIVVLVLLFIARRNEFKGKTKGIIWWVTLLFMSYIFIISGSRTGIVVLVIGTLVQLYFSSLRQKRLIVGAALSIIILVGIRQVYYANEMAPRILLNRITKKKSGDDPRIPLWSGIISASQETNFTGLGIGQFKANFHKYYHDENNALIRKMISRRYFLSPHSDYFALLIVYGVFGLICYLIFLFLTVQKLIMEYQRAPESYHKIYYRYSLSIFVTLAFFGLASESLNSPLFWLMLSLSSNTQFTSLKI